MTKDALMTTLVVSLTGTCALATLMITYYARVVLPRRMARRVQQAVIAFSTAIELRIPSHKGLSERVVALSHLVGSRAKLSPRRLKNLELAARLRDIGLCAVPYDLVNHRPSYDWTLAEWSTYFKHAEVGAAMLELVPWLAHLAPIVRLHHSPFHSPDGNPFPQGQDLPIESRILKLVGDYVWSSRNEGAILARDHIKRKSGQEYDPELVQIFLDVLTSTRVDAPQELAHAT